METIYKSITDYALDQARNGVRVLPGNKGTYWAGYEFGAMMRIPTFHLTQPTPHELRSVFWRGRVAIASYLLEPDERHAPNAWLYLCTDQSYALDKLAPPVRRNVRRGLKELSIVPLTAEQMLMNGVQAFCDTRRRAGLSDGTPDEFRRQLGIRASLPEVTFLGAWRGTELAAFLTITAVDDWAELGCYSADSMLCYRPNDALMYSVLSHCLVERKCRVVSYGLSSIQAESNADGLHRFKTKLGFESRLVHRAFVPHPLLYPFINNLSVWGVNTALKFRSGDRRLKKLGGMLDCLLGKVHIPGLEEINANEEKGT